MATLLHFFKKISPKIPPNSSPIPANNKEKVEGEPPKAKPRFVSPKYGKERGNTAVEIIENDQEEILSSNNGTALRKNINGKRMISDGESDDDEVTGKKVSFSLMKLCFYRLVILWDSERANVQHLSIYMESWVSNIKNVCCCI